MRKLPRLCTLAKIKSTNNFHLPNIQFTNTRRTVTSRICFAICMFILAMQPFLLGPILTNIKVVRRNTTIAFDEANMDMSVIPTENCEICENNEDISFPILVQTYHQVPPLGNKLFIFVSNSGEDWYVGSISDHIEVITEPNDIVNMTSGCYGKPGPIILVACLAGVGVEFESGEALTDPPFNDRCTNIGYYCGASCGIFMDTSEMCNFTLFNETLSRNQTFVYDPLTERVPIKYWSTYIFVIISIISSYIVLLNNTAGLYGTHRQRGTFTLSDWLKTIEEDGDKIKLIVFTSAYSENKHVVLRSLLSTIWAFITIENTIRNSNLNCNIEFGIFFNDDSKDKRFKLLFQNIRRCSKDLSKHIEAIHNALKMSDDIQEYSPGKEWEECFKKELKPYGISDIWDQLTGENVQTSRIRDTDCQDIFPINIKRCKMKCCYQTLGDGETGGKTKALNNALDSIDNKTHDIFFSVIDARHAPDVEFFWRTLPEFWRRSPTVFDKIERDTSVRFVVTPHYFPLVNFNNDDYLDRQNGNLFWFTNTIRRYPNMVTSAGTNTVWHIGDVENNKEFRFGTETLIEDTETSHLRLFHENSVYVPKSVVAGSVKDKNAYIDAVGRWSTGSIQLLKYHFRKHSDIRNIYITFLIVIVVMPVAIIFGQNQLFLLMLINLVFSTLFLWGTIKSRRLQVLIMFFNNTTYPILSSLSAIFWTLLFPIYLSLGGAFPINVAVLLIGQIITIISNWAMVKIIKSWSREFSDREGDSYIVELQLWRAYQVWGLSWYLHLLASWYGFFGGDSWTSNKFSKYLKWAILFHLSCLGLGAVLPFFIYNTSLIDSESGFSTKIVGIFSCIILILSFWDPATSIISSKDRPFHVSSRHIMFIIMIIFTIVYTILSGFNQIGKEVCAFAPTKEYQLRCIR